MVKSIEEFVSKLDAGQITDFSLFLEKSYSEHFRAQMVKRGILVREALEYNEELPIIEAIRANLMEERYEQWSTQCTQSSKRTCQTWILS